MADLAVTPANVRAGPGAKVVHGRFGATVTHGQSVSLDSTDNRYKPAGSMLADGDMSGIALTGGAAEQPATVLIGGDLNPGAAVVPGTIYVLSDTPGGIKPVDDIGDEEFVTIIGVGTAANRLAVNIHVSHTATPESVG